MDDRAYLALDAIGQSGRAEPPDLGRWIKAFQAIRWVVQTETGLALTPAGRQARDEMAARRANDEDLTQRREPSRPRAQSAK